MRYDKLAIAIGLLLGSVNAYSQQRETGSVVATLSWEALRLDAQSAADQLGDNHENG